MGWTDILKDLGEKIAELFKTLTTIEVKLDGVDKDIERVREDQRQFIQDLRTDVRTLQRDFMAVERRLVTLEGMMQSIFQTSLREAILQMAHEHLEKHGSLDDFNPGGLFGPEDQGELEEPDRSASE